MENKDIRWEQRFANFRKAVAKIGEVAEHKGADELTDLEKEGLIQRFEYTYELAWKTLQDLLRFKGYQDIAGPNPVMAKALEDGYISPEQDWREMKVSRDLSSHTYDSETAEEITENILDTYYSLFLALEEKLNEELSGKNDKKARL